MTDILKPDICVIGAGSAGLTVAAAAASFGVDVVLIEKGEMGGDCLNYGCVPSKALLAAGHHAQSIRDAKAFGVHAPEPTIDYGRVHDHIHEVIGAIAPNDSQERFEAMGVTVLREAGVFTDKKTVKAGDKEIRARRFVIATGSGPAVPPIEGIDSVSYFTNETIFGNTERPEHLVIIGGGPIGMEMAQAHRQLGAEVTVLEGAKPLGKDDPELTSLLLEELRGEGDTIRGGAMVKRVRPEGEGVAVEIEVDGAAETVTGSHLLVAAGRAANVNGLGLDAAGITYDKRGIKVDDGLKTTNSRVYAIGDVAGGLQFTHVAGYQASLVVRNILFRLPIKNRTDHIPWVTFTAPELAHVGQTEAQAREAGTDIEVLRWPYAENDRAQAERKTTGLIKVIATKKGKILGASILGAQAGEMINMWALAVSQGMNVRALTGYVAPYPTLSEIGRRAAVTHFTPFTQKGWVRGAVEKLRVFG
ncbi:MAG: FAD-dependent oxidoreductase [Pseudomonadota bacterium]